MRKNIVCFGELLVDMIATQTGTLVEVGGFEKKFGGAPANTAVGIAKLGGKSVFIGKVGDDPFGHFLRQTLENFGVDISQLILTKLNLTTLAFVSLTETGERDFIFYPGAHELIEENEVFLPPDCKIFHFGSLTQITPVANAATEKLIKIAQEAKVIISYDPNVREFLWKDLVKAREVILQTMKKVSLVKLNEDEAKLLSGESNLKQAAEKLFLTNLQILIITLGAKGSFYKTSNSSGFVETKKVEVVDTTGAGDAFNAAFLHFLSQRDERISDLSKQEIEEMIRQANFYAAETTTKKGAI